MAHIFRKSCGSTATSNTTDAPPAAQTAPSTSSSHVHAASLDFDVDIDSSSPASSPTLQGSSPAKPGQLSPLRLPSPIDLSPPSTPLYLNPVVYIALVGLVAIALTATFPSLCAAGQADCD
ncbi:hypothetical protein C8R47DRAFT_1218921 [Mycena vitilis]|nr:hypothetical protein C8R47DRAFT_1218921 [Mycena vitilis]